MSAWDITKGDNTVVAVIDTCVDGNHEDLQDRMVPGWNFVKDNNNTVGNIGHGIGVVSILAASENGKGMSGAVPETNIFLLKHLMMIVVSLRLIQ